MQIPPCVAPCNKNLTVPVYQHFSVTITHIFVIGLTASLNFYGSTYSIWPKVKQQMQK